MSQDRDPVATSQRLTRAELPKRFYASAAVGRQADGFAVLLDGKVAKTPGRRPLAVPSEAVAAALAAEWAGQGERIDPATMPLTRLVNAALDAVAGEMPGVRAEIVKYAGTDLICYRAENPQSLVDAQEAAWGPLVRWAAEVLGARLVLSAGVVHAAQAPETAVAVERVLATLDPLKLAALHVVTTITGSAVIALALLLGRVTAEEAFSAALVDEDWQMARWGRDEIALKARASRWREIEAAALILGAA